MPKSLIPTCTYQQLHIRSRGYIPHWELRNAIYSITYRLHDSLPREVLYRLQRDHEQRIRVVTGGTREPTAIENARLRFIFERKLDEELDRGWGAAHLRNDEMAAAVAENLAFHDGKLYDLLAWCVMPNHVHAVICAHADLDDIFHSWKSYTAHRAAKIVGVRKFWAREYWDRMVRNEEDLNRTIRYVLENPLKAGLADWTWVGSAGEAAGGPAGGPPARH